MTSAGLKSWDAAAGVLILADAGGRSSSVDPDVVATNGRVHSELLGGVPV